VDKAWISGVEQVWDTEEERLTSISPQLYPRFVHRIKVSNRESLVLLSRYSQAIILIIDL